MADLEIAVCGVAHRSFAPERASIDLTVHLEGADRESVYTDAVAAQRPLIESLTALRSDGAVDDWRSDSIRVYSHRPIDAKGEQGATIYSTRIGVGAEFVDFEKLSEFIDTWAVVDGVDVGGVRWDVSEDNRRVYQAEVRREAVADAVAKAQAYADAVGYGPIVPTLLADPEMHDAPRLYAAPAARVAMDAGGAPSLELRSEDIRIEVSVNARFTARLAPN